MGSSLGLSTGRMLGSPPGKDAAESARGGGLVLASGDGLVLASGGGLVLASGAGGRGVQPDPGASLAGGGGSDGLGPPTPGRVLSCGNSRALAAASLLLEIGKCGAGVSRG